MVSIMPSLWFSGTLTTSVAFMMLHVRRSIVSGGRSPISEKMLRPPGHSLRVRLDGLEERLWKTFALLAVMSVVASFAFSMAFALYPLGWATAALAVVLGLYGISFPVRLMLRTFKMIRHYRLGLLGEEVVGEQLSQLMLRGCQVFHDVPADGIGNIDHVVVSPRGVFAVETKTRRKPVMKDGHKVIFTGKELRYPTWTDSYGLAQAASSARWLAKFLTESTGAPVKADPILTLPGWMVELRGKNCVSVVNPKQIREVVLDDRRPMLDLAARQRICHQLERKCRDVAV